MNFMADFDLAGQHVLLVDDVFYARETVKRLLFTMGKPDITEAPNGQQAIKVMAEVDKPLTMVITDFQMPTMNGLQLLKAIRAGDTPLARDFPVAMLTGYSERQLVDVALALDVNAFLIKPVSRDALARRLQKMVSAGADQAGLREAQSYGAVAVNSAHTLPGKAVKPGPDADGQPDKRKTATVAVPPAQLEAGTIVGRDVFLNDGRLYMSAGVRLTPRYIALLQDLADLQRLETDVWVFQNDEPVKS